MAARRALYVAGLPYDADLRGLTDPDAVRLHREHEEAKRAYWEQFEA